MGRNRDFNEEDVLNAVADVFVANGYKGTSIQMLTDASGLGKQSLYNAFGDKQALYLKSVECAVSRWRDASSMMAAAATGRAAIEIFFELIAHQCASRDPAEHACIVSIGLLEGVEDEKIAATLNSKWRTTHTLLKREVVRGQKDGSITNPSPASDLADYLMSFMSGLRVSARVTRDTKRITRAVNAGLKVLSIH